MQILTWSVRQFAVVAIAAPGAPFGIPATAFWIYVSASLVFVIGFLKILKELPRERGIAKVMPFGRLFFAIPLAVFGSEHFTITANIAELVPRWIPFHTFWAYLVGLGLLCAAVSIAVLVQARLAAALVAMMFLAFVLLMDIPAVVTNPGNRFFWALAFRQLAFSGGALAFAISRSGARTRRMPPPRPATAWAAVARFFLGVPALFYGVEHLLHPEYVPGVPLKRLTPEWVPAHVFVSYAVGVILIAASVCLVLNMKARLAATTLGLTVFLTVLWVYLPMLLRAPTDIVALNFFFDTLLFSGAVLLLASAMGERTVSARI